MLDSLEEGFSSESLLGETQQTMHYTLALEVFSELFLEMVLEVLLEVLLEMFSEVFLEVVLERPTKPNQSFVAVLQNTEQKTSSKMTSEMAFKEPPNLREKTPSVQIKLILPQIRRPFPRQIVFMIMVREIYENEVSS